MAGGLLVASQSSGGLSSNPPSQDTVADAGSIPATESQFCEVTANSAKEYFQLAQDAQKARDDKNGILEKRALDAMTAAAQTRNNAIFRLVQSSNFTFEGWRVRLLEIGKPNNGGLSFSVRPLCSKTVTIHLLTTANGPAAEGLATTQKGDTLVLSGKFVEAYGDNGTNAAPRDPSRFERSITERGSMEQPEYRAVLR
ncbi:MAG: hypothetical protein ACREEK_29620 [Bradyrhizobium sp.]